MSQHDDVMDPTTLPIFAGADPLTAEARRAQLDPRRRAGSSPALHLVDDAPPARVLDAAGSLDWAVVARFRKEASEVLTTALGSDRGRVGREMEREQGRAIISQILQNAAAENVTQGRESWSMEEQHTLAEAIFDSLFGMGRLQPLLDDDSVENIIITGAETVWLQKTDGSLVRGQPVADSDTELLEFLMEVASRSEGNARPFSPAHPNLHMRLDDGSRLAAAAWVTPRPSVVIRRHRLQQVTLADLVDRGTLTPVMADFLAAAVKAGRSVVVAGSQGAGKTTLLRALASSVPFYESIATFETEYELHLDQLKSEHAIVHAWESRPGSGERGPDGREAGAFTIDEALYNSFRFNADRQFVGEVRGPEVWAMIKAMESGAGSLSTTHARSAEAAIRKLVTCAMEAGSHVTRELATSKLAETIDLIVHVDLRTTQTGPDTFTRTRWVSEIIAVTPGEEIKGYATTRVFSRFGPGPGMADTLPDDLRDLTAFGFDEGAFLAEAQGRGDRS